MLVTDVGDEMCWWQLQNIGDGFGVFDHQHLLFHISIGHQHSKDVTNIHKSLPTQSRQHQVTVGDFMMVTDLRCW